MTRSDRDRFALAKGAARARLQHIISRADAASTIPEEVVTEVIKAAAQTSAALALFRQVNMGTKLATLPVLSALAQAYFVNGDTGLKQTTEMAWSGVTLEAEEIAAIVPVPEAVVDDSASDVWAEVQAGLAEAVGIALDQAVFAGLNKPGVPAGRQRAGRDCRRQHERGRFDSRTRRHRQRHSRDVR